MAKDAIEIRKFLGITTVLSKEDRPVELLQTLVNLRPNHILGRAVKRGGYASLLSTGITALKWIKEFKNKNDTALLMIQDGNTLKESVNTSGSYAAVGSISNDERTAGSTIDGDSFLPVIINKELRSGVGISAATQRPIWYGYIAARNRFNSAVTISAERYLDEQDARSVFKDEIIIEMSDTPSDIADKTGAGLDEGYYTIFASPVIDGYQRGIPTDDPTQLAVAFVDIKYLHVDASSQTFQVKVFVDSADIQKFKRVTAIDLFVAYSADALNDFTNSPAYFLERVDMNSDGDTILEITGDVGTTNANKITISNAADWRSFNPVGLFVHDVTNDDYYRITAYNLSGTDGVLTVTPVAAANGAATLRFLSRWWQNGTDYQYQTFYDGDLKKLGAEMYTYLNIPLGDTGLTDFRYKYIAWNGARALYSGFPSDGNFSYFSTAGHPDVVPALNIFRHRDNVRGLANVGQDFLVFTDKGTERLLVLSNEQADQDDRYLDAILTNAKSIVNITDDEVAFMTYKGAYLISGRRPIFIGEHLKEWWNDNLTASQKEACVGGYNHEHNEVWFSFPTYTTSPYTSGVIMVFDLEGYRRDGLSPWWFVQTDKAVLAMDLNTQYKLIAGAATSVVNFDGSGAETVSTTYKVKLLKNIIPSRRVRWGRIHVDTETSDTVSCNLYFDGSATPVALTLNTDLKGLIQYLKKTLEVEITTAASTNSVEHLGMVLEFTPMRVK